jgi:hypothetical protein
MLLGLCGCCILAICACTSISVPGPPAAGRRLRTLTHPELVVQHSSTRAAHRPAHDALRRRSETRPSARSQGRRVTNSRRDVETLKDSILPSRKNPLRTREDVDDQAKNLNLKLLGFFVCFFRLFWPLVSEFWAFIGRLLPICKNFPLKFCG